MRSFYTVLILILLVNINGIAQTKENQNPKVSIFNVITETFPDLINGDIDWGDFNQDGLMDFVMCGSDGSTLYSTVYKNNGDSTFTDITAGLTPIQQGITRWVDFNNDGYLDILISGNSGSFITELYSNNGDETFSMVYNSFTGLYVCDAVWADFNNDGWQDLVIAGDDGSAKSLYYINNGDTTFTLQSDPFTDVQNADIEVLDYNKDGYKDVIITGSIGGVSSNPGTFLYSNNGDGTFTYMSGISFTGVTYGDVKCADFNADGFTDVFIIGSNPGGRMAELYKNNGDSTFTKETTTTFEGIIHGYIALADWDNDGDIDIHYNGSTTSLGLRSYFYSNDGDFSFSEDYNWIEPLANSAGQWADFNNNGKQDILILGLDGVSAKKTYFYSSGGSGASDSWATNTAPAVAHHLTMEQDGCGMVTLKWDGGTDNENTDTLNSYNVYLGTAPGTADIVIPASDIATGQMYLNKPGNALNDTIFIIKGLQSGTYYWSVQTIDAGYLASDFAQEEQFDIILTTITTQPVAPSVCAGADTAVSVELNGTVSSYLWQYSKDGGTIWRDTTGTQARFVLDHLTMDNNLWLFRCKIETPCQTIYSNEVELIIHPIPAKPEITQTGLDLNANFEPGFDNYQWYNESGAITGETNDTYSPTTDGGYSVEVTSLYGCSNMSDEFVFDYQNEPFITTHPVDIAVCENTDTALHIETSGDVLGYQWQVSTNGGTDFNDITDANAVKLELNQLAVANSGNLYRCIITNDYYEKISDTAEVIVHENPEPVVTDADYVLTSTTADAYQWYKDNVIISGANSQSLTVSESGEYWVVVTNDYGCEGASNRMIIVIESVENELSRVAKIYPNPAHDILKIDSDIALDKVEIYNAIGQLFYSMQPSENNLNINISEYEKGMYLVKLSAGNNSHTYRLIIE